MMPIITEYDKKMMEEAKKWLYVGNDGLHHLKVDTPIEIKKHHEKMKKIYNF